MSATMTSTLYSEHFCILSERYNRVLENHQFDQLLIYSGTLKMQFIDDIPYPFHSNPHFKALVPLTDTPDSWIIWRPGEKPLLLLYQPHDFWHTIPKWPVGEWVHHVEIKTLRKPEEAKAHFGNLKNTAFLGETIPSPQDANLGQYLSAYKDKPNVHDWELGTRNPPALYAELNWYRNIKTPYEQYCIRTANRISVQGHGAARDAFLSGASEFEIAMVFQQTCEQNENELAYPSIVGINQQAAVLHKQGYDKTRQNNDLRNSMLIDAGAHYNGYASDITRTHAFKEGVFANMIAALDEQQQIMAANIIPGNTYVDATQDALLRIARLLKEAGVLNLEPESAFETGVIHAFMPHRLGHFLGLQVHDVGGDMKDACGASYEPDERFPRSPLMRPFEAGQVITIEPGLYFIDMLLKPLVQGPHRKGINWTVVEQLKPFGGIRIEDNVLITATGAENLTRLAFEQQRSD